VEPIKFRRPLTFNPDLDNTLCLESSTWIVVHLGQAHDTGESYSSKTAHVLVVNGFNLGVVALRIDSTRQFVTFSTSWLTDPSATTTYPGMGSLGVADIDNSYAVASKVAFEQNYSIALARSRNHGTRHLRTRQGFSLSL